MVGKFQYSALSKSWFSGRVESNRGGPLELDGIIGSYPGAVNTWHLLKLSL
jgi:hypothetical protein